jgi:5'-nucleotidase
MVPVTAQRPRQSLATLPGFSWDHIEVVLLDMDGTLLDLAFDNFFWLELVPAQYAEARGLAEEEARRHVARCSASVFGSLAWYCVEHWSGELGFDVGALKWRHRRRIGYLPGARDFLAALRRRQKPLVVVTNAHRRAIEVKVHQTGLDALVDGIVSSHDFDAPKESPEFWVRLQAERPFDPQRTLLVEDSLPVLEAARAHGIRHAIAVRRPDSGQPPRDIDGFPAIDGVADLI